MVNLGSFFGGVAGGMSVAIVIRGIDKFSSEFKKAETRVQRLKKSFKVAAVGITGAFAMMTKQAAKFERTQIAFEVMLGSAKKAKKMLKDLAEFSKKTPFKLTELEENARLLLGMGIEAENLIPTMKALGDVSAGLNLPFERLALNFGQVKAQGRLLGTELRDFARGGVPIIAELAKNLNITQAEVKELASQGRISFEDVEEAFRTMSSEGGKFANLMERSMGTVEGGASNLQDGIEKLSRSLGTVLLPAVNSVIDVFGGLVEKFNNLDEAKKALVSKTIVGAGVGVAGAGAGFWVYDLLKGSRMIPMKTFETNPAALGGGGFGKYAKGAGIGGVLARYGAGAMGTGAMAPFLPAMAWSMMPGTWKEFVYKGASGTEYGKGLTPAEALAEREKYKVKGYKVVETTVQDVINAISQYTEATDEEKIKKEEVIDKTITINDLTGKQSIVMSELIKAEREHKLAMDELEKEHKQGKISEFEYQIEQKKLNETIKRAREEAKQAIPNLENFASTIRKIITSTGGRGGVKRWASGAEYTGPLKRVGGKWVKMTEYAPGKFRDFISRPGQPIQQFSPDDTIIGVKDISRLGGSKVININIDTVQGLDPDAVAEALQEKLSVMISG